MKKGASIVKSISPDASPDQALAVISKYRAKRIERDAKIREMVEQEMSTRKIAEALGVEDQEIYRAKQRLELSRPRRGTPAEYLDWLMSQFEGMDALLSDCLKGGIPSNAIDTAPLRTKKEMASLFEKIRCGARALRVRLNKESAQEKES